MPMLDKLALYFFFFTFFCYLIIPIVCARVFSGGVEPASFVFTTFTDAVGYESMEGGSFVLFMVRDPSSLSSRLSNQFDAGADISPLLHPSLSYRSVSQEFLHPLAVSTLSRTSQRRSLAPKRSFPEVRPP